MLITCPSGLKGTIRKLKVAEANALADDAALRRGDSIDNVLKACWLETEDAGPYNPKDALPKINWDKALVADRFYTVVQLRVATYGSAYDFKVQCTNTACRKMFPWRIDLVKDLPVRIIPSESLQIFMGGNKFSTNLAGKQITFRLQDGAGERAAARAINANKQRQVTISLNSRIIEIEGVESNDKMRWIENLDMDEVRELIARLDDADGGVETSIEVECDGCASIQETSLPLGKEFWLPSSTKMGKLSLSASSS